MANQSFPPGLPRAGTGGAGPEAALLEEHWGAVLCYADLCTTSPAEAARLAGEAFTQGIEWKGQGSRLPWLALLLKAVLDTAGRWHARGQSERLSPELRIWLNAERAAAQRSAAPDQQPARQPLALRALAELPEADAELLWTAEVEGRAAPGSAANLGAETGGGVKALSRPKAWLERKARGREIARVRKAFREGCLRIQAGGQPEEECRGRARPLDAATPSPNATPSEDPRRRPAGCAECGPAAVCLAPDDGGLPGALATGVLGWGGLAYLERRRRAAVAGKPAEEPTAAVSPRRPPAWASPVAALALITGLALVGVITTAGGPSTAEVGSARGVGAAGPRRSNDLATSRSLRPTPSSRAGLAGTADQRAIRPPVSPYSPASRSASPPLPGAAGPRTPKPPAASPPTPAASPGSAAPPEEYCTASYRVVEQWAGGFKAEVQVTSRESLNGWSISWRYPQGQLVDRMWDGTFTQDDGWVTATPVDYDKNVPAGKPFTVGLVGSWRGTSPAPRSLTLNGHRCQT